MTIYSEKIGLDPEKLRQLLNQQIQNQDSHLPEAAGQKPGVSTTDSSPCFEFDLIPELDDCIFFFFFFGNLFLFRQFISSFLLFY